MKVEIELKTLGDIFRYLREKRNIEQQEVAKAIGVSCSTLCRLESNGTKEPPFSLVMKLAEFYNIKAEDLFKEIREAQPQQKD